MPSMTMERTSGQSVRGSARRSAFPRARPCRRGTRLLGSRGARAGLADRAGCRDPNRIEALSPRALALAKLRVPPHPVPLPVGARGRQNCPRAFDQGRSQLPLPLGRGLG